jgi:hypothetical protein
MPDRPPSIAVADVTLNELLATAEGLARKFAATTAPENDPPALLLTYNGTELTTRPLPEMYTHRQKALVCGILLPETIAADGTTACALVVPIWTSAAEQGPRGLRRVDATAQRSEAMSVMVANDSGEERHYHMPIMRQPGQAPVLGWSLPVGSGLGTGALATAIRHGLGYFEHAVLDETEAPTPQRPRVCAYRFADEQTLQAAGDALAATSAWGEVALLCTDEPDGSAAGGKVGMCVAETPDELDRFRAVLDEFGEREPLTAERAAEVLQGRRLLPVLQTGGMPRDVFSELPGPTISRRVARVGRNDPCRCGSGRKAKRCCAA